MDNSDAGVSREEFEQLSFRVDILKECVNLNLKERGVVLLWIDEYEDLVAGSQTGGPEE